MSRVMYLECFSGAAGDMLLGALLDAGLPLDVLTAAFGSLGVGHTVTVTRVMRCGVGAVKFDVTPVAPDAEPASHAHPHPHADHADGHRSLGDILRLIEMAAISPASKRRAGELFRRMAEVEAGIHGVPVEEVQLHEVGALDSIIDIVGVVVAMEWFGIDDIEASPLNVGSGTVEIAHGRFPVPAPATLELLQGVPVYSDGPRVEMVTPTGALLVTAYARAYGTLPAMTVERTGYGAGTRDMPHAPNVLRVVVGERAVSGTRADVVGERVLKIETEIDDMSPQLFGPATERLFGAGALDVFLTPVFMKKGRPGTLLTIVAPVATRAAMLDIVFRETSTIGVRIQVDERETLERRWEDVDVEGGLIRIKIASRHGEILNVAPEFDDCVRVAAATDRPIKMVHADAVRRWNEKDRAGGDV